MRQQGILIGDMVVDVGKQEFDYEVICFYIKELRFVFWVDIVVMF